MEFSKDQILDFAAVGSAFNNTIGVSYKPTPKSSIPGGLDKLGKTFFTNADYANSDNTEAGKSFVDGFKAIYSPFGVLKGDHVSKLDEVAGTAADTDFIQTLSNKVKNGITPRDFTSSIFEGLNIPVGKEGAPLNASLASNLLYNKWDNLSPAQKSLGISQVGIQGIPGLSGLSLADTEVPGSQSLVDGKGIKVNAALQGFDYGLNSYALTKNWPQLDVIGKLYSNTKSVAEGAQVARSLGMLGFGTEGAAVNGMTREGLDSLGAFPAPEYGIGALSLGSKSFVPAGYQILPGISNKTIVIPTPNANTSAVSADSLLNTVQNVEAVAEGTHPVVQQWSKAPTNLPEGDFTHRLAKGALGGAQMSASLAHMGMTNPYVLAAAFAFSVFKGVTGTGKSKTQQGRDFVRSYFKENGFVDNDFNIKVADGTIANIGTDGHGGLHSFRYDDKVAKAEADRRGENKLNAYDTDYTNDLDYFSGTAGAALSRLLTGTDTTEVKQLGGQLGNAALGKVGYGADFTPDNFSIVMNNMKSIYAKAGVDSREEAYALANKMYAGRKINDIDLAQIQSSVDMVFNNDFRQANNLAAGRFKGVELAITSDNNQVERSDLTLKPAVGIKTKEDIIAQNKVKFMPASTDTSMGAAA